MKHILGHGPVWVEVNPSYPGCVLPETLRGVEDVYLCIHPEHDTDLLMESHFGFSVTLVFDGEPFLVTVPFNAVRSVADVEGDDHMDLVPHVAEVIRLDQWRRNREPK